MGVGRNGIVETGLTVSLNGDVAQECPQARGHLLDGTAPACTRARHEIAANIGGTPTRRVRSKCGDNTDCIARVEPDCRVRCSAMFA
jgi:hypothetical protein